MKGNQWSESAVNKVVPKRYPSGDPIPPEVRREIYAFYLLEQRLKKLKHAERMKKREQYRKVSRKRRLKRVM